MNNNDLIYDWLDFMTLQKSRKNFLLKEQNPPVPAAPALKITPVKTKKKRSIIKENIIQVPNNLRKNHRNTKIEGIVIHHTVTNSAKSTLNVLSKRGYSTNFEVDQEGRIYEYIDPNKYYAIATGGGANNHTIAIDVTTGNESWPFQQVQSVKNLVDHLSKKYGFQLNLAPENLRMSWKEWKIFMSKKGVKYTLFRHKNFAATACPASFPMDKLISGTSDSLFDFSKKEDRNEMKSGLLGGKSDNNDVSPKDSIKKSDDSDSTSWASIFADDKNFKNIDTTFIKDLVGSLSENIDRKIYKINDKTKEQIYSKYKKYFNSLLDHLKKELKITKPVKIVLEEDEENSKKVLGRTGGYINHEIKIHIFCSSRHIKDIMRSLSHEMVHHSQNIRGEFKNHEPTEHGYAQTNKHLRKMEEEAYLKGNILFRDWEDNYKYRNKK